MERTQAAIVTHGDSTRGRTDKIKEQPTENRQRLVTTANRSHGIPGPTVTFRIRVKLATHVSINYALSLSNEHIEQNYNTCSTVLMLLCRKHFLA